MTARYNGVLRKGKSRKLILVIDDDSAVRESLRNVLEVAGCAVCTAEDGQEGIDQLRTKRIDLVVLDLNLPVISGWDVLDLIREERPSLPLIILSGELRQCEPGAFDKSDVVLEKPCDPDVLLATTEKLLARAKSQLRPAGVRGRREEARDMTTRVNP
jgi:DNA-binding response OmpR family regulator